MRAIKDYLDMIAAFLGCGITFLTGMFIIFAVIKALIVMWNVVF